MQREDREIVSLKSSEKGISKKKKYPFAFYGQNILLNVQHSVNLERLYKQALKSKRI